MTIKKIKTAEFSRGITGTNEILTDDRPQIAFVGRSNVGKSSLINSLVGNKKLARSSSTPGKTQEINFFLINNSIYFVDLPGYGFARLSKKRREKLRKMIIWYLTYGEVRPRKVVLIVDAKVGIKEFDLEMIKLLQAEKINFIVVANKIDKVKKNYLIRVEKEIKEKVGEQEMLVYSSKTLINKFKLIESLL